MSHISTASLFYPGNVARVQCQFVNSGNNLVDPTSVFVAFHWGGSTTTVEVTSVVNPSTGIYYYDLQVNSAGEYFTRFTGTGNAKAQAFGAVHVTTPNF